MTRSDSTINIPFYNHIISYVRALRFHNIGLKRNEIYETMTLGTVIRPDVIVKRDGDAKIND